MVLQVPLPPSLGKETALEHPHSNAQRNLFQVLMSSSSPELGEVSGFIGCASGQREAKEEIRRDLYKGREKNNQNLRGAGAARGNRPLTCYGCYHPELLADQTAN